VVLPSNVSGGPPAAPTPATCTGSCPGAPARTCFPRLRTSPKDERLADAMRQLLERHDNLHVIVTEYVSALADAGRAPATIERALAAIAAAHRAAGAGGLRTDGPRQVLRMPRL
jgi:hypothetical protein